MTDLRYQILPHLVFILSKEIPSTEDLHMITSEKMLEDLTVSP